MVGMARSTNTRKIRKTEQSEVAAAAPPDALAVASPDKLPDVVALLGEGFAHEDIGKIDAAALQSMLRKHLDPKDDGAASKKPSNTKPVTSIPAPSRWMSQLIKSLIGVALVVTVGWMPAQRLVSGIERRSRDECAPRDNTRANRGHCRPERIEPSSGKPDIFRELARGNLQSARRPLQAG